MKLSVYVLGREVATLEQVGDFRSVTSYHPGVAPEEFISLTMPVRTESYSWDDLLPPVLQMNLPEGYLLQVLQEQFGPHVGASPVALLAVVGRNMIGRVQAAAPGAELREPARTIEVAELLKGDNSEEAFAELVRQHATSGVSGVLPKFLDAQAGRTLGRHPKATLQTRKHIIKGSSGRLPHAALNEHLCMQVMAKLMPTARTEISDDGKALVVHRFDVDADGHPHSGMEDFCALLGMRPANKYETTWERIAKAVRDHVPGPRRLETFRGLATVLLGNYALRNADCHAKNIALLYTSRADVHLAPAYDMLTTGIYPDYRNNPPGIGFMGKKTWTPGKTLGRFIAATFGLSVKEQVALIERIGDAVADMAPRVREAMRKHPEFADLGARMLLAWQEGVQGLRDRRTYAMPAWVPGHAFEGFSAPPKLKPAPHRTVGRSELIRKPRR